MTKRERVLKAFRFEQPDRIPIMDWVQHGPLAARMSGRTERIDFWTIEESGMIADRYFDMCQGLNASFPQSQEDTRGMKVLEDEDATWYLDESSDGFKHKKNYWMGSIMERPFHDTDGAISYVKGKIEEIERGVNDTAWEHVKQWYQDWVGRCKALANGTDMLLMTPHGGLWLDSLYIHLGWEHLTTIMFEKPDLLKKLIDTISQYACTWIENVVDGPDLQPIALIHCDIAHTTGLMLSPDWLKTNLYENIERMACLYHSKGIGVIYHSEGNITRVIDDLISLGVDGINPLEKTVTGMSVPEIRKRWPNLVLWGGIDNKDLLVHGTVADVKKEVEFLVTNYGKEGGLILGSSGQVHPGCKTDNVVAMYETAMSIGF